jgi:N-dimethylarginine dimethylaminohydrolase
MERNPHFMMCQPRHFAVTYAINPWMDPQSWARGHRNLTTAAAQEWRRLHATLRDLGARIELVPPVADLPDLVFTANSAVVLDGTALLARFRHPERQGEEPHYEAAFRSLQAHGLVDAVRKLPDDIVLEGAGDCVWDGSRQLFWMGYGPRSSNAAVPVVADTFGVDVVALELADARFYHMDTALRPLPGGEVIYFPAAFSAQSLRAIRDRVAADDRIEIAIEDAGRLAANAVCVGDAVVTSECSETLRDVLRERGYRVVATPLPSFLRSGGGAFCLTLRLDQRSVAGTVEADTAAA